MEDPVARFLASRPLGAQLWIRVQGRSMWPVLRTGDSLLLQRCAEEELALGDIAVGLRPEGHLVSHLVAELNPVRLSSFFGTRDPTGTRPLARAVAVRLSSGVKLPLPAGSRTALRWLHLGGCALHGSPRIRQGAKEVRGLLLGSGTKAVRERWLGALTVRALRPADVEPVIRFTGDHLSFPAQFISDRLNGRWQQEGVAVGAVGRAGRLAAFAFGDAYQAEGVDLPGFWVRGLMVTPLARGLGLSERIVRTLIEEASARGLTTIHADVLADNVRSLRAFAAAGFAPDEELTRRHAAEWRRRGDQRAYRVLTLGPRS